VEKKVINGAERSREEDDEEREIGKEEVKKAIKRIKEGKTSGINGIPGEAGNTGEEELEGWIWEFCNKVWKGEGWPEE